MRNLDENNPAWMILIEEEQLALTLHYGPEKSTWQAGEIMKKAHYKYLEIKARGEKFLKIFIERIIEPGFAYKYLKSKGSIPKWNRLLTGRTARVLSTMDSPPLYMTFIVGDPGGKMMKDIITFTGMKFVGKHYFGSVRTSSKKQRKQWLEKAYKVGTKE